MIDHNNKILFIHIPKNAGTSIERVLFANHDFSNKKTHREHIIGFDDELKFNLQHATISQLLEHNLIQPNVLDVYDTFAVVRNPFERAISGYFWLMKDLKLEDSFENFLTQKGAFSLQNIAKNKIYAEDHFYTQSAFITHNDTISIKKLIRFESLTPEFNDYMKDLNLDIKLNKHFKKNKKNKLTTLKLFTKSNIKLIQNKYEIDFVNFDYNINFNYLKMLF